MPGRQRRQAAQAGRRVLASTKILILLLLLP